MNNMHKKQVDLKTVKEKIILTTTQLAINEMDSY